MEKVIVTDMDDVLVNLLEHWLEYLNTRYDCNVKCEDVVEWDMSKAYPTLTPEQLYGALSDEELWKAVTPRKDAIKYLTKLHNEGYKILVATAASYNTIKTKLVNALFPYFKFLTYKDIIMIYDKHLLKCSIIIDDYHENLRGSDAVKILVNAPYNKNCDEMIYDFRVDGWKEIYQIIHELENVN